MGWPACMRVDFFTRHLHAVLLVVLCGLSLGLFAPAVASAACADYCYQAKWASQGATGIAVDSLDNVYVADSSSNRVEKYSPDGELLLTFGAPGSGVGQF